MKRRYRSLLASIVAGSLAIVAGLVARTTVANEPDRPNIIFFLSDDHRADFLGCAGHPIVKTPTIDRLAAGGVRFENAFVTTSICAASRASIFTGLVERTHKFTFGTPPIARRFTAKSYPALLRAAGYRTGFVGKFGVKVERGEEKTMFDFIRKLNRNPYFKKQKDGTLRHVTEIAGDVSIEFLKVCPDDQPFCLSVSFNAAHAEDGDKVNHFPWPQAVDGLYEEIDIPAPRHSAPDVFASQPQFLKESLNRKRWFWRWDTPEKYQRNVKAYYRMITGLDRVIGRVLDEVKRLGRHENTVIVFSGDNGYYKGARGFAGKWSHYEESLRVPLVVFDPRGEPGRRGKVVDSTALNVDIAATILDYAAIPVPQGYHGRSLVPWVRGDTPRDWRRDFFCEHLMEHADIPKWEGVRGERYVYARYFQQEPVFEFLHDLDKDPGQLRNFAADSEYAEVLERMRKRSDALRDGYGGRYEKQ